MLARNEIRVYDTMHNDDNFQKKFVNMNYGSKKDSLMQLNTFNRKAVSLWKCGYEGKGRRISNGKLFSDKFRKWQVD